MLSEEIKYFDELFKQLQSTDSRTLKQTYVNRIPAEYQDDFKFILEVLNGRIKTGYKFYILPGDDTKPVEEQTLTEYMKGLYVPMVQKDFSEIRLAKVMKAYAYYGWFLEPIINRTLKLGIGASLLETTDKTPMLAKKYEGIIQAPRDDDIFVTEKLDGNRCLAWYDELDNCWKFQSRNGKQKLNYSFNMVDLPKNVVFDGEVISLRQYHDSRLMQTYLAYGGSEPHYSKMFNKASGQMNRKKPDMQFIYCIFDYISAADESYSHRRDTLNTYKDVLIDGSNDVRILPILAHFNMSNGDKYDILSTLFRKVSGCGAEGLMLNIGSAKYQHKRCDSLLKYKGYHTVDLKVIGVESGTGKYTGAVGALVCQGKYNELEIFCNVGSGLSDEQRWSWALDESQIVGKIVEVEYFDISQRGALSGTNMASLRFPRFIRIRYDKSDGLNF